MRWYSSTVKRRTGKGGCWKEPVVVGVVIDIFQFLCSYLLKRCAGKPNRSTSSMVSIPIIVTPCKGCCQFLCLLLMGDSYRSSANRSSPYFSQTLCVYEPWPIGLRIVRILQKIPHALLTAVHS